MENASKALIIAGAILLSILIIALGMNVFNSANDSAANADLSATEVRSFNSTFEAYEGRQKGTSVRSLITAIQSSNQKNEDRQIEISEDSAVKTQNDVKSNKSYTVTFTYAGSGDDEDAAVQGLITGVTIK